MAAEATGIPFEVVAETLPGEDEDNHARYIEVAAAGARLAGIYLPNGNSGGIEGYAYKLRWMQRLQALAAERLEGATPVNAALSKTLTEAGGRVLATCSVDVNSANTAYACGSLNAAPTGIRQVTFSYCSATDVAAPNSTCPVLGLLKSVDGPRVDIADITSFEYYPADDLTGCDTGGPCHRRGDLRLVTNATGASETYARYDRDGRPRGTRPR